MSEENDRFLWWVPFRNILSLILCVCVWGGGGSIFMWVSLCDFIGNCSKLDYINICLFWNWALNSGTLNCGIRNCYAKDMLWKLIWIMLKDLT